MAKLGNTQPVHAIRSLQECGHEGCKMPGGVPFGEQFRQ